MTHTEQPQGDNAPTSELCRDRSRQITIVLADHHWVVRAGVRLLLDAEQGVEVVAEAGDLATTERHVSTYHPRVLVLDPNLPDQPGLSTIVRIRQTAPATHIVVLTIDNDPQLARAALHAGATSYVSKQATASELLEAVRLAADGRTYRSQGLTRLAATPHSPHGPRADLSPRETEVLRLIALGHSGPEIASQLQRSPRTVRTHRAHILQKTGRTRLPDLVAYAREHELI
jgi:two-component system, NarL family, response regulator NreC